MNEQKNCPFVLIAQAIMIASSKGVDNFLCIENKCALWVTGTYSTEGRIMRGRCAIKQIAEKNSDGKLPV